MTKLFTQPNRIEDMIESKYRIDKYNRRYKKISKASL